MVQSVAVPTKQTQKQSPDVQKWAENDAHQSQYTWEIATRSCFRNTQRNQCLKKIKKNLPDKAAGRIIEFSNILKKCTKMKTDVENCRLLQHAGPKEETCMDQEAVPATMNKSSLQIEAEKLSQSSRDRYTESEPMGDVGSSLEAGPRD